MSKRKDRERFMAMRRINPDYGGFRGHQMEPNKPGNAPLAAVTCSVCGRKRNVPVGEAQQASENYVCITCREAAEKEGQEGATAPSQ